MEEKSIFQTAILNFLKEWQTLVLCQILKVIWVLKYPPLGYEEHPAALKSTKGAAFQFIPNLSHFVNYAKHLSVFWSIY